MAYSRPSWPRSGTAGIVAVAGSSGPELRHTPIGSSCSAGKPAAIAATDFVDAVWEMGCAAGAALGT